uniref:Ankyrin repeat, SAM and basic leucine zipper domain containing 1 n=1 Tax=Chrysemys picta bellii TaxID=8478 RepID=A0A8C3FI48_CHRPI
METRLGWGLRVRSAGARLAAAEAMPGVSRSLAVAGGGESSDSDEDRWVIGFVQDKPQQFSKTLQLEDKDETLKKALSSGDVSMIEELLNSGVNVESSFQFGWTPLMYAASVANVELVRILLDRGANASFDKDQYTVLMAACTARASEEQILKTVELLLSRNANPSIVCRTIQLLHLKLHLLSRITLNTVTSCVEIETLSPLLQSPVPLQIFG